MHELFSLSSDKSSIPKLFHGKKVSRKQSFMIHCFGDGISRGLVAERSIFYDLLDRIWFLVLLVRYYLGGTTLI